MTQCARSAQVATLSSTLKQASEQGSAVSVHAPARPVHPTHPAKNVRVVKPAIGSAQTNAHVSTLLSLL